MSNQRFPTPQVKIDGMPIPKGRLVKGPYKNNTLLGTNIAMENPPFLTVFTRKDGDVDGLCWFQGGYHLLFNYCNLSGFSPTPEGGGDEVQSLRVRKQLHRRRE